MSKLQRPVFYYGESFLPELEDEYFRTFELSVLEEMKNYKDILRECDDVESGEHDMCDSSTWNLFS